MAQKNRKQLIIFIFCSARCSLFEAEGFSGSLNVFNVGIGIRKLQFLVIKRKKIQLYFFPFFVINTLDPDPQHCFQSTSQGRKKINHMVYVFKALPRGGRKSITWCMFSKHSPGAEENKSHGVCFQSTPQGRKKINHMVYVFKALPRGGRT
jgi:hypothetical protein